MITELNGFIDFVVIQPTLVIELKKYMEFILSNNLDIPQTIDLDVIKTINDFIPTQNTADQFGAAKKIFISILDAIKAIHREKKYNFSLFKAETFFTMFCSAFNLFQLLFTVEEEKAQAILKDFSNIYFYYSAMTQNELVLKIKNFLNFLQFVLVDNEFMQSVYVLLLRLLMARKAILIDQELTERLNNMITSQGVKESFIEPYDQHL